MKRLVVLAVMVAFILGATIASAAQLTVSGGDFRVHGNYVKNPNFLKDTDDDPFQLYQRFRTNFNFVANENLRAVVQIQFGGKGSDALWGNTGDNGLSAGAVRDVQFRQAYLQFNIPNTQATVKAGHQYWALPSTIGSHIWDARTPAFVLSTPINEMIGLTLGYARSNHDIGEIGDIDGDPVGLKGALDKASFDHFLAIVPVTMDGISLNPFAWYARQGKDFGDNEKSVDFFFAGINATLDMFDPIAIHADFNYGSKSNPSSDVKGQAGWIALLAAEYKMDMFTPMLWALYESGESKSSAASGKKGKIMPRIAGDLYPTTFGFGGAQFGGTAWYQFDNIRSYNDNTDAWIGPSHTGGASGKMAIGLKLKDISFMDKLTHTAQVVYYQGTNNKENVGLFTTKDKAWEVNFDTKYQVYENLAAILELGYINLDLDERFLVKGEEAIELADDASWKAAFGFRYRF
jgi:hypothetical protein